MPSATLPFQFCVKMGVQGHGKEIREMEATYGESDVVQLHSIPIHRRHPTPVLLNIQSVRSTPTLEVIQHHVPQVPTAAVTLDHERLVPAVRVDVLVHDVRDRGVEAEAADRAPAGLVAPDALDRHAGGGGLGNSEEGLLGWGEVRTLTVTHSSRFVTSTS